MIIIIIALKFAFPSEQYVDWGNDDINFFDEGSKFATPYEQYVGWANNINFIFISTWSQTRRNVRVAANILKQPCSLFFCAQGSQ